MEEYAISFFTLIEYSLILDGEEYLVQANISALPYMSKSDQNRVLRDFGDLGRKREPISREMIVRDRKRLKRALGKG